MNALCLQAVTPVRRSARKPAAKSATPEEAHSERRRHQEMTALLERTNFSYTPNKAFLGDMNIHEHGGQKKEGRQLRF